MKAIDKAKQRLEGVKEKSLSIANRCDVAIEIAGAMLETANKEQTSDEKKMQQQLAEMMGDPEGKAFAGLLTDQCFRSRTPKRIANQLVYLINKWGIPNFLSLFDRIKLLLFKMLAPLFPRFLVPLTSYMIRQEMANVVIPGEKTQLKKHLKKRYREKVRLNVNHLGEAILGEKEAERRLEIYLKDLAKPSIEYISIKISTIFSQVNLLSWDDTLEVLAHRLRKLYRTAMHHQFVRANGTATSKFVNLDMEEYKEFHLTIALFRRILDEPEFFRYSAGIVLQSYLPEAFSYQKELTEWARERVAKGGAPIKIRLVKGANLAMEKVEASMQGWPQAPFDNKCSVDGNFKRMLIYGTNIENAKAVHLGVASHNLFDIAFAMLLRNENSVAEFVDFEMLEGMADHIRRVVQDLTGKVLLYCPIARKEEFQNAVAYLIRRLDENTGDENFLRYSFGMKVGDSQWKAQVEAFTESCEQIEELSCSARRNQDRLVEESAFELQTPFDNEANTDFSSKANRKWIHTLLGKWAYRKHVPTIPLVIGGETLSEGDPTGSRKDPSYSKEVLYRYYEATSQQIEQVIDCAIQSQGDWRHTTIQERVEIAFSIAQQLRIYRGELIAVMVTDGGKIVEEADAEVSEAIDFVEYYRRSLEELYSFEDLEWLPKGAVLVASPWNFPCAIPIGGIVASLLAGNSVIFKPAPEAVLVGWRLSQILWKAGVPKTVLQFINCPDDPEGTQLISSRHIDSILLTGATETAKFFYKQRPGMEVHAESGGKNGIIVTAMADRDLAIKNAVYSAFAHAGQKCSAASLLVCEAEVYDDPVFRRQLHDAAQSLSVGSAWDFKTKIGPLVRAPDEKLKRALTELDAGEEWLLEPCQDSDNEQLWSPGIKLGVKKGSFTHLNELFGPVLAVMRADDLDDAISIVNMTKYGLTAGIQSLDPREQALFLENVDAGNYYINRAITGAVVRRQPFGGCKESCFGQGLKAGGPNYLLQLMRVKQKELPKEKRALLENLAEVLDPFGEFLLGEEKELWNASVSSYTFWWKFFQRDHDPSRLYGQDNLLRYLPRKDVVIRLQESDELIDQIRIFAAILICGGEAVVTGHPHTIAPWKNFTLPGIEFIEEDNFTLFARLRSGEASRLRFASVADSSLCHVAAEGACSIFDAPVLANGRVELLYYLREASISIDYHRYGNLGIRESEKRKPLAKPRIITKSCEAPHPSQSSVS